YLHNGVDGDGDGKVDLRGSAPDAIMTAARKLAALGWRRGEPWLEEVRVPDSLPWEKSGRAQPLPRSQWAAWGVTAPDGGKLPADDIAAGLVLPMGHKGPAFLVFANFDIYI